MSESKPTRLKRTVRIPWQLDEAAANLAGNHGFRSTNDVYVEALKQLVEKPKYQRKEK